MKQGRVSRPLFVLVAAGAVAACQVVSGLASLDEPAPDGPGLDGSTVDAGAVVDGRAEAGKEGRPDAGDAGDAALDSASRSCLGLASNCGTYEDPDRGAGSFGAASSCCERLEVPGGTTKRVYDYVADGGLVQAGAEATIAKVALDRFEVTVGRFLTFLTAYEQGWHPAAGSGSALRTVGDLGWTFDDGLALGTALRAAVAGCQESTLTHDARSPINCITYAEAFAFCIYDGGRLPTEAEWAFTAAGGAELRMQPFSVPPSQLLSSSPERFQGYATGPTLVGSHPAGLGLFRHEELLGNVAEWVRDAYVSPYPSVPCTNCMIDAPDASAPRTARGTGFGRDPSTWSGSVPPRNTMRDPYDPATRTWDVGVRCAYDLH